MSGLFVAVASLFGGAILWCIVRNILRGLSSESSWSRTTGQVKSFKVVRASPACIYHYQANGVLLEGKKIQPGIGPKVPDAQVPKSVYLTEDGRLKFIPGQAVEVFYNPKDPADSALVAGIPPGIGKGIAIIVLIVGVIGFCVGNARWTSAHQGLLISLLFFFAGLVCFILGTSRSLRFLRSRKFPSTSGKVLKATRVYVNGQGDSGGGYLPEIEVRYEVNGVEYCATELSSSPIYMLRSKDSVEGICRQLLAEPKVTVYYNPQAPWLGFLRHGPLFAAFLTPLMGLVFMMIGVFIKQKMG